TSRLCGPSFHYLDWGNGTKVMENTHTKQRSKYRLLVRNSASQLLNVPVPYLLRHAAFLYENQLRGVKIQLRRDEAMSSSSLSGSHGNRNRASSLIDGSPRPPSALSSMSKDQFAPARAGHTGSQDMMRTGSNTSLSDGKKLVSGSISSSITVTQSLNE
ncbi:13497_t:CDS:2, partial [Racocetra persica]